MQFLRGRFPSSALEAEPKSSSQAWSTSQEAQGPGEAGASVLTCREWKVDAQLTPNRTLRVRGGNSDSFKKSNVVFGLPFLFSLTEDGPRPPPRPSQCWAVFHAVLRRMTLPTSRPAVCLRPCFSSEGTLRKVPGSPPAAVPELRFTVLQWK